MIEKYTSLYNRLENTPLQSWLARLPEQVRDALSDEKHGDLAKWRSLLEELPCAKPTSMDFNAGTVRIGDPDDTTPVRTKKIKEQLFKFHPWRKGPYSVFGIYIDTEWRSDWKWNRLKDFITPLENRLALDVGCGNGYHCWRMLGAGARLVVGIDPYLLSVVQFHALKHYTGDEPVYVLPLGIEDMPDNLNGFDTVFSMGVFYHRRSPFDHLFELKSFLRGGGELALETLVIDGGRNEVLVPEGRYANMRNVWFIPSCLTLESWLVRAGFKNVRMVNVCRTTAEEQRPTEWMTWESLPDFLDPDNPDLTIEGHPAPKRAIFVAEK